MYVIVLGIVALKLQISVSDSVSELQFPIHNDLQKVGEATFRNEKFSILKTATHVITDHFKEFMLREAKPKNPPGKKIFIDKNGFRHEWSGFGEKVKSLRKTDLKPVVNENFINASEKSPDSDSISTDINVNTTDNADDNSNKNVSNNNSDENSKHEEKNNALYINETVQIVTKGDNETDAEQTAKNINLVSSTQDKTDLSTKITIAKSLRDSKDAQKGKNSNANAQAKQTNSTKNSAPPQSKGKTVMETTFFCPYLGIITMSAFLDV